MTASQQLARGVMGLSGDFSMGGRNFNWEVAANYGSSRNVSATPAYVFQNVQNALNATLNSAGQIVCAGNPVAAPVSTGSSTCAPLNIFGLGSPSLAARQYITHVATAESFNTQRDLTAFIGGDLFKLPAGEVKGVIGYETPARDREVHSGYFSIPAVTASRRPRRWRGSITPMRCMPKRRFRCLPRRRIFCCSIVSNWTVPSGGSTTRSPARPTPGPPD